MLIGSKRLVYLNWSTVKLKTVPTTFQKIKFFSYRSTKLHTISNASRLCTLFTDSNKNVSEGGDQNLISRQKKGKAKVLKWRLSNTDMDMKGEEGGSDGDYDDTVLSSLTTASFSSLISRKRVKSLGKVCVPFISLLCCSIICFLFFMYIFFVHFSVSKVAEDCDAIDPPVPRKLRSGRSTNHCISSLSTL